MNRLVVGVEMKARRFTRLLLDGWTDGDDGMLQLKDYEARTSLQHLDA
jgi:hypothetical protein